MTTIHHCMHIHLTCTFVLVWHANRTHFETLYLASDRYCIHMYVYTVELLFNHHVIDMMIIIILCSLLSIYLWLYCEFRALVICIYIVYTCTYIVTYMYLFCTHSPQCVLALCTSAVSASHHRQMWSVH